MMNGDSHVKTTVAYMAPAMPRLQQSSFVGSARHVLFATVLNVLLICVPLALLSKYFQIGNVGHLHQCSVPLPVALQISSFLPLVSASFPCCLTLVQFQRLICARAALAMRITFSKLTDVWMFWLQSWVFVLSLVGIVPLAERLGFITEQLAYFTGPTVGGLLNATFGNATEMIICVFALRNNMIRVVQLSLLGSILSNMLLVLGCAFLCGGFATSKKEQKFDKAAAHLNSSLLLMAVMCVLFPAALHATRTELHLGQSELLLSRITSCVMLVAYSGYIYFQLNNPPPLRAEDVEAAESILESEEAQVDAWSAIFWLAVLTVFISILSEYIVDAIEGASEAWHVPVAFISVIVLPIVGNAAEHSSAIVFAAKDNLDLSLAVAIGSSIQISMLVIPVCVILGWPMGVTMDLNFELFETAVLFISVLVVAFMLLEGTANYFKGYMLVLCYFIVGASFFVHVDPPMQVDSF